MNSKLRQLAVKLRLKDELSYSEIMNRLGVPKSTLSYWLGEMPLSEEKIRELQEKGWKKSEAGRERYRNTMRHRKKEKDQEVYQEYVKKFNKLPKNTFFIAGLILYLGEGGKKDDTRIVLANTDPEIIRFFIKWLIDFLDVNKESIRVQLHLYENMALEKEQKIWQNITGLNKSQFYKTSVRKLQKSSFTYQGSHGHGTCSVYVLSVEKKRRVSMAIKAFLDSYLSGG